MLTCLGTSLHAGEVGCCSSCHGFFDPEDRSITQHFIQSISFERNKMAQVDMPFVLARSLQFPPEFL